MNSSLNEDVASNCQFCFSYWEWPVLMLRVNLVTYMDRNKCFCTFQRFFSGSKTATFQALVGYCFYAKYLLFWKRHRFQMNSKTKKTYLPICVCFCINFLFKDSYSTFFYTNVISICFKVHSG